jgi:hypothetical protein
MALLLQSTFICDGIVMITSDYVVTKYSHSRHDIAVFDFLVIF